MFGPLMLLIAKLVLELLIKPVYRKQIGLVFDRSFDLRSGLLNQYM
jgi:hypothetical protein